MPYASMKVGGIGATPEGIPTSLAMSKRQNVFDELNGQTPPPNWTRTRARLLFSTLQSGRRHLREQRARSAACTAPRRLRPVHAIADDTAGTIRVRHDHLLLERINTIQPEWLEPGLARMAMVFATTWGDLHDVWRERTGGCRHPFRGAGLQLRAAVKQARD